MFDTYHLLSNPINRVPIRRLPLVLLRNMVLLLLFSTAV